jgi:protein SCO1/2
MHVAVLSAVLIVAAACASAAEPSMEVPSPAQASAAQASAAPTEAPEVSAAPAEAPEASAAPIATTAAALEAEPFVPQPAPALVDLVNADGSAFDLADFAGSPTLVFFGYTHCPDVCPTTIGEIFGVFQAAPQAQAVFVSVDPERDTPAFLAKWTEFMPDNFNAVTGSPGAIRRAADGYGVKYARVETTSTAGYTMSHTANVYLIDEDGQWLRTYPFGTPAADIVADISTLQAG